MHRVYRYRHRHYLDQDIFILKAIFVLRLVDATIVPIDDRITVVVKLWTSVIVSKAITVFWFRWALVEIAIMPSRSGSRPSNIIS